jgi:hypothetical protein
MTPLEALAGVLPTLLGVANLVLVVRLSFVVGRFVGDIQARVRSLELARSHRFRGE